MIRNLVAAAGALLPACAAAAEKKGMPQLNFGDFTPQLVWLAMWFIVLYLLMAKLGLPRISAALEARRRRREEDLARAAQMKADAEAANAAHQRVMAAARAEAQAILKQAGDRLAAEAAERQRALAAVLAAQIAAAERNIVATKEQALTELRGIAVDVGRAVVEKLTGSPPDAARLSAAVDSCLAEQPR
jgi:F-type H+-transporting ATPase subunit b